MEGKGGVKIREFVGEVKRAGGGGGGGGPGEVQREKVEGNCSELKQEF